MKKAYTSVSVSRKTKKILESIMHNRGAASTLDILVDMMCGHSPECLDRFGRALCERARIVNEGIRATEGHKPEE